MEKTYLIVIYILFALIIGLIIFIVIQRIRNSKNLDYRQEEMIDRQYDEVKNTYKTMRGWRHDFHNHIQTIRAVIEQKQYDKLDDYLKNLDDDLMNIDILIKTGNLILDAILNSKISLAKSKDIKVIYKAALSDNIRVSNIDLCIIIGNLMDNAIDACMLVEDKDKRFIRIYVRKLKEQLYINITNSTNVGLRNELNIFATTKDKISHGNGLKRVDITVKKYSGYVNRQNEPNVFATEITIPL